MAQETKKSIVIIGGGISGLSAARRLRKSGSFHVLLLEATNRVGGRIWTTNFGSNTVELGAQWVHGEKGNKIFEIGQSNGLLNICKDKARFGAKAIFVTENGEFLEESIIDRVTDFTECFQPLADIPRESPEEEVNLNTLSLGEVTTKAFWKFNNVKESQLKIHEDTEVCAGILDWMHRFQNSIDGADDWNVTSYIGQGHYKTCEGDPTIEWKSPASYSSLLNWILNDRNAPEDSSVQRRTGESIDYSIDNLPSWIKLGKEVIKIQHSRDGQPSVICKDGSDYNCDFLICTIPLGVLKENHASLFKPSLPTEKVSAIEHIGFGTVNKIFLEFETSWWPPESDGFNLVWDTTASTDNWVPNATDEILSQIDERNGLPVWTRSLLGFYTVPAHPTILVAWITGAPARYCEKIDTEDLKSILTNVLKTFVGNVFKVPDPINITRSTWFTNQFSRGSYSFRQLSTEENNVVAQQLAEPIYHYDKPIICFAGEATHPGYYSTVHGAYDSGIREADRIIKFSSDKPWFSFCPFLS